MEANKILSANILDLIFDGRNKEYGAYELRVTYPERVKKSMIIVFIIAAVAIAGAALASSLKPGEGSRVIIKQLDLTEIPKDEKKPEPIPEQKKPEPPPQVQTKKLTQFDVVPDDKADNDIPTKDDLEHARIDIETKDGVNDEGLAKTSEIDKGTGIIEPPKDINDVPFTKVEVEAKFNGNWEKFIRTNLDPMVPVDKGAPVGKYNVIIQFVVDLDGNVSDIKPLTAYGYGMESEAVRVLRKAVKWEPAIQNGHHVKAYCRQPITFVVEE